VGAVQLSIALVLVVEEAASAVGALGGAVQVPGPLLPLQDGKRRRATGIRPRSVTPTNFFPRALDAIKQMPRSENPVAANNVRGRTLAWRIIAFAGGVVVIVTVVCAPAPVGVTGLVEKLVALQAGGGEPAPVTLHVRLTGRLYPLSAVRVTVDVADVPAFTAAGVVAEIRKPFTAKFTVAVCMSPPNVPVTVTL
jgi:hypothetical protein